jgi:hypothetical protein
LGAKHEPLEIFTKLVHSAADFYVNCGEAAEISLKNRKGEI